MAYWLAGVWGRPVNTGRSSSTCVSTITRAEARMRQHTQFLNSLIVFYAANPGLLVRGSARAARPWGLGAATSEAVWKEGQSGSRIIVSVNGNVVPDSSINLTKGRKVFR